MASYPTYDPPSSSSGIPQRPLGAAQRPGATTFPLNNRAIAGPVRAGLDVQAGHRLAGLRTGAITPATTINDTGSSTCPGAPASSARSSNAGGAGHGMVNLQRALTVSSDVYFYTLGVAVLDAARPRSATPIQDDGRRISASARRPASRCPASSRAACPTPTRCKAIARASTRRPSRTATGSPATTSTSPSARATCWSRRCSSPTPTPPFANGGTLYPPSIALKITDASTRRWSPPFEPRVLHQVRLPPDVRDPMMHGLHRRGELDPKGTAYGAFGGFPDWTGRGQDRHRPGARQDRTPRCSSAWRRPTSPQYVGSARARGVGLRRRRRGAGGPPHLQSLADPAQAPDGRPRRRAVVACRPGSVDNANGAAGLMAGPSSRRSVAARRARPARCAATRPRRWRHLDLGAARLRRRDRAVSAC